MDPNQYAQEEPYIGYNIGMTRLAFGLNTWTNRDYSGTAPITEEALRLETDTFANARLWDYRPLQATLRQLQTVRQYYDFTDVDTDRYTIGDQLRQVMLSARELAIEKNPQATGWVNTRIVYTHGIGVAMVPVNEVTPEGQPRLWIKDLPPVSEPKAPEINAAADLLRRDATTTTSSSAPGRPSSTIRAPPAGPRWTRPTRWTGTTGVPLDTTLTRLLFALRFSDLDLLISDQITAASQLLFHRTIGERLDRIAPFLRYDKDPYLVIDDAGRLVYVQDAYTISDSFPNAHGFSGSRPGQRSGLARDRSTTSGTASRSRWTPTTAR